MAQKPWMSSRASDISSHERLVGRVDRAARATGVDLVEDVVDVDARPLASAAAEELEEHDDDDADDAAARRDAAAAHGPAVLEVVAEPAARVPELDHGAGYARSRRSAYSARSASTARCRAADHARRQREQRPPARPATSATDEQRRAATCWPTARTPICSATSCQATRPIAMPSGMPEDQARWRRASTTAP